MVFGGIVMLQKFIWLILAHKGSESVYEVRQTTDTEEFVAEKISTHDLADAKAHNITVDFVNQVMFVTHSGPNVDGQLNQNV